MPAVVISLRHYVTLMEVLHLRCDVHLLNFVAICCSVPRIYVLFPLGTLGTLPIQCTFLPLPLRTRYPDRCRVRCVGAFTGPLLRRCVALFTLR